MRWKECQPIFKCHSLLFWIPALLCATDLNWVNITCGAPLGPSVHARSCGCMHVCEHGSGGFKPWFYTFYHLRNFGGALHHFALCETHWLQLAMTENFPNQQRAQVLYKSIPTYCLTELRFRRVQRSSVCLSMVYLLCVAYAWLWCNAAEAGVSRWSLHRLIDTDNNTHNSQWFCP